jgi:hypothetical protein
MDKFGILYPLFACSTFSRANLDKESEPFGKYTKAYNGGHFLIHGFITGISLMMKALKMMFFYLVSL